MLAVWERGSVAWLEVSFWGHLAVIVVVVLMNYSLACMVFFPPILPAYREPITYNSQVFLNVLKTVYKRENLAPPTSLPQITSAYRTLFDRAKSIPYWQDLYRTGEYKKVAVGAVEVYGIFKIGEILGRRSLVGYKLD